MNMTNATKIKRLIYTVSVIDALLKEFHNENNAPIVRMAIKETINQKNERLIKQSKKYDIDIIVDKEVSKNNYHALNELLMNYLQLARK